MYARVTKVLAWILPIIQSGECGWIKNVYIPYVEAKKKAERDKDAALRRDERIKKVKKKGKNYG